MRMLVMVIVASWLNVGDARAEAPAVIAKKLVTEQVAALKENNDNEKLGKTFTADGVIAGTGAGTNHAQDMIGFQTQLAGGMQGWIDNVKLVSLVAGGDDKVIWISADLEFQMSAQVGPARRTKSTSMFRLTEVAVQEGGKWKAAVALLGMVGSPSAEKYPPSEITKATKRLSMTKFLVDPKQVAFQLPAKDDTVVVYGTDKGEKAVGAAAGKKLLESWKSLKLEIEGEVREVEAPTYGYVLANVNWVKGSGPPIRMRALIFATREKSQPWVFRAVQFAVP